MTGKCPSLCAFWIVLLLFSSSRLLAEKRFSLAASILSRPTVANCQLITIELKNTSTETQKIRTLDSLFQGTVYLRDARGDTYNFIHQEYWKLLVTSTWITPEVKLAPGQSHIFRHALSEFIDWRRTDQTRLGNTPNDYANLSEEFGPGCEIWCELDIRELKPFGKRSTISRRTAVVRSPPLIDIRPPLLYNSFARTFRHNPFTVEYAPLLTREEQEQPKSGDELYAEYEERRAARRTMYPRPLRSLMEAQQAPDDSDFYEHALNGIRQDPPPELFRQFVEWIDEGTCEVSGMFEFLMFDRYLWLDPWEEANRMKAMRSAVEALPCVRTSLGLEKMLAYILQGQGGGHFKLTVPACNYVIDIKAERTAQGSYLVSGGNGATLSEDQLSQVADECRTALRQRYPDLQ